MKLRILLVITAVIALIQFATHAFLFIKAVPHNGPEEVSVLQAMQSHLFKLGGIKKHTYWDLYFGYGLLAAFMALIQGVLILLTSRFTNSAPSAVRPITLLLIFFNAGHASLLWIYFSFPVPIVFDLAIGSLLLLAHMKSASSKLVNEPYDYQS